MRKVFNKYFSVKVRDKNIDHRIKQIKKGLLQGKSLYFLSKKFDIKQSSLKRFIIRNKISFIGYMNIVK